ncbi:hypothetical protein ACFSUD_10475 [Sulfitobacter aestuarii]|uniref:Transmembrane protein n=1 Tax=Sulfitobacter aestuarii TaxID=2161676 RepID=A0ABW5U3V6_9RHOB
MAAHYLRCMRHDDDEEKKQKRSDEPKHERWSFVVAVFLLWLVALLFVIGYLR